MVMIRRSRRMHDYSDYYSDDQEEEKEDAWGSTQSGPVQSKRDQPLSLPVFCYCWFHEVTYPVRIIIMLYEDDDEDNKDDEEGEDDSIKYYFVLETPVQMDRML